MTTTADQMKIFDTLNATSPSVTVIDSPRRIVVAGARLAARYRLLDAPRSGQITFAVFHILGPSIASLDEIAETANSHTAPNTILVRRTSSTTPSSSSGTRRPTIPISTASRTPPS